MPAFTGFSGIKKPACGRLLGGGFGLFLANRARLQSVHPVRGGQVLGFLPFNQACVEAQGCLSAAKHTGYWRFFPAKNRYRVFYKPSRLPSVPVRWAQAGAGCSRWTTKIPSPVCVGLVLLFAGR